MDTPSVALAQAKAQPQLWMLPVGRALVGRHVDAHRALGHNGRGHGHCECKRCYDWVFHLGAFRVLVSNSVHWHFLMNSGAASRTELVARSFEGNAEEESCSEA